MRRFANHTRDCDPIMQRDEPDNTSVPMVARRTAVHAGIQHARRHADRKQP